MRTILTLILPLLAGVAASIRAQAPASSPAVTITAISGRVLADGTGEPVANARVTLATGPRTPAVTLTDGDGRFTLAAAAAAGQTVVVGKTGYARTETTVPFGRAIEVRLKKGAAVSGRVVDRFGNPAQGVRVTVSTPPNSARQPTTIATVDSDDRGEYRIGSLPEGGVLAAITVTIPGSDQRQLNRTSVQTTYYPGVVTPVEAQELRLQPGDDRSGIDFVVPAGQAFDLPIATLAAQLFRPSPQNVELRGAGIVRGRVAGVDGLPIAHAQVFAFAATRADSRTATTDEDGRFEIGRVASGTVRIGASKVGYTQLESGAPITPSSLGIGVVRAGTLANFAWGHPLDLADGEIREQVELTLARWGTLSGRIFDEHGDPIQGAAVQLLQTRYDAGQRRLAAADAATATTDDLGRYRLHSLATGQYVVTAAVGQVSAADIPGYARSYYPGTPSPADAQFVAVGLSQDVAAVDFSLSRVRTAHVAGDILNPAGQPAAAGALILLPSGRSSAPSVPVGARIEADGRFDFPNVAPGQYVIQAYRGRANARTEGEFGALPVVVNGTDITDLKLQISSGSSVTGRITFETLDRMKTTQPSQFELVPIPADVDLSPPGNWASAEIQPDWTFEIAGLNGPRRLQIVRAPPGWALKEIRVNGVDVADRPLSLGRRDQSLANVEVVMTDRVTELRGTVADERGQAVSDSNVLVFSTEHDRWYFKSRYLRQTAPAADGSFVIAGLPPGSYYAAASARVPIEGDEAWQDSQLLESLVARASIITLLDGQKAELALRLSAR